MNVMSPGAFLSQAADLALGAERLVIAALIRLEDAEASLDHLTFVTDARLEVVDLQYAIETLSTFAGNLIRLADAYGHAEVSRRAAGRR